MKCPDCQREMECSELGCVCVNCPEAPDITGPEYYDPDRPEVMFLEQAHSIRVIVKGKKYLYNIYDIPRR